VEVELDAGLASAKEVMAEVEGLEGTMEEHTLMEPSNEGRANGLGEGEGGEHAHQLLRPVKEDRAFQGPCELFLVATAAHLMQRTPARRTR
jgi:hypothetical protein